MLSSLLCLPNCLGTEEPHLIPLKRLSSILLEGLRTEENGRNMQNLLFLYSVFVWDNIGQDSSLPVSFLNLLLHKIMPPHPWPADLVLPALYALTLLANFFDRILQGERGLPKDVVSIVAKFVTLQVLALF